MKLYETINAENWTKNTMRLGARSCLAGHGIRLGLPLELYQRLDDVARVMFPERCDEYRDFPCGFRPFVYFNDHPLTTVEDVIRVCKVADV